MTAPEITYPPPSDEVATPYAHAVSTDIAEGKQLNLTQLTDELSKATGHQVEVALTESGNLRQLAAIPGNLNPVVVQQVIDAHDPVVGYEIPEEERAFAALLDKAAQGATKLTAAETQTALLGLLRRAASASSRHR